MGRRNRYSATPTVMNEAAESGYDVVAKNGARLTKPFADAASDWKYAAAASGIAASTTAVTIKTAAGAGLKNYITSLQISHATLGNATELAIRDGAAGTVIWRMTLGTVANENISVEFNTPISGTANTLLEVVTLTSATGGVYVNAQGYTAP